MRNKHQIVVTAHPEDICECGDFRHQHDDKGACKICVWANPAGMDACTKFRGVADPVAAVRAHLELGR